MEQTQTQTHVLTHVETQSPVIVPTGIKSKETLEFKMMTNPCKLHCKSGTNYLETQLLSDDVQISDGINSVLNMSHLWVIKSSWSYAENKKALP